MMQIQFFLKFLLLQYILKCKEGHENTPCSRRHIVGDDFLDAAYGFLCQGVALPLP